MRSLARWHIWLGWLVGLPIVLWTLSGLVMVARPIEEVRGAHLMIERPQQPVQIANLSGSDEATIREARIVNQRGRSIAIVTFTSGKVARFDIGSGKANRLAPVSATEARQAAAWSVRGGDRIESVRLFDADNPPLAFRRAVAVWQVVLTDGTHVYVGRDSGEIEAVRTRWWRIYDLFWGLHIMDLGTREDAHNPWVITLGALALAASAMGVALLFRRRTRTARRRKDASAG